MTPGAGRGLPRRCPSATPGSASPEWCLGPAHPTPAATTSPGLSTPLQRPRTATSVTHRAMAARWSAPCGSPSGSSTWSGTRTRPGTRCPGRVGTRMGRARSHTRPGGRAPRGRVPRSGRRRGRTARGRVRAATRQPRLRRPGSRGLRCGGLRMRSSWISRALMERARDRREEVPCGSGPPGAQEAGHKQLPGVDGEDCPWRGLKSHRKAGAGLLSANDTGEAQLPHELRGCMEPLASRAASENDSTSRIVVLKSAPDIGALASRINRFQPFCGSQGKSESYIACRASRAPRRRSMCGVLHGAFA